MIGDSIKDVEAAENAGIKAIFLKTDYNKGNKKSVQCTHILTLKDLL